MFLEPSQVQRWAKNLAKKNVSSDLKIALYHTDLIPISSKTAELWLFLFCQPEIYENLAFSQIGQLFNLKIFLKGPIWDQSTLRLEYVWLEAIQRWVNSQNK